MSVDTAELEKWFKERPKWLQDAARRLFQNGIVTADDLKEFLVLSKREVGITVEGHEGLKPLPIPAASFNLPDAAIALRLDTVSEIKGINALAPRKGLEFGIEPIVIVYGATGSGKSGYIRLLKHACGGKGLGILHGDVFAAAQQAKSCKISYSIGATKKDLQWTPAAGVHTELRTVSLYDTDCAHIYMNDESEVAYEPPLLSYFRMLVQVCEKVDGMLAAEIAAKVTSKPALPPEYALTASGIWFSNISWQTSEVDMNSKCAWNDTLETELGTLSQRLAETNPIKKAKALRKTKGHLIDFSAALKKIEAGLSDELFVTLVAARAVAKSKRQAADIDAKKAFENPLLDGIASESWRLLWKQARLYSQGEAYKGKPFPNVGEQALCVLPKAKKVWTDEGSTPYQVEAKALCSDIRITIERLIEYDLLADVVQRFRRPINTQGKIEKLARIKPADCTFLDAMMTKYSRYEHAQPGEAPVPLPEPDELSGDLQKLKAWLDEFTARVVLAL
jgi:hypothetical protein